MGKSFSKLTHWEPAKPTKTLIFAAAVSLSAIVPFVLAVTVLLAKTNTSTIVEDLLQDSVVASIFYTISQALASTLLVILTAPILALFLCYTPMWLCRISLLIRTASFCFPSIVVASGLILAWGNNGLFTRIFRGFSPENPLTNLLYSDYAVVMANALMTVPFCSVILFKILLDIPNQQLLSARLLRLGFFKLFRAVLWPAIRPALLYYGCLSFLMSMGSFGALSILGTGPKSRTIELFLYQAVYFEGNWQLAGLLSLIHTLFCGFLTVTILSTLNRSPNHNQTPIGLPLRLANIKACLSESKTTHTIGAALSLITDFVIMTPICALLAHAYSSLTRSSTSFAWGVIFDAIKVSISLAIPAAILITLAAGLITRAHFRLKAHGAKKMSVGLQMVALSGSIIPPMSLAFGFLVLQSWMEVFDGRHLFIVLALTASILPFALSVYLPVYGARLSASHRSRLILGLSELTFFRRVEWKVMQYALGVCFVLATALCLNETSIVTMLGDATQPALTTTMTRLMNQYRFGESSVVACLLIFTTIAIVFQLRRAEGLSDV